jgi:adenine-specific DNA methylase
MKYMGSKRLMLKNGLGILLKKEIIDANRFIDIFVGSGTVAAHVAENFDIEVNAFDLQLYSAIVSNAIISREEIIYWQPVWNKWERDARELFKIHKIPSTKKITQLIVKNCRAWCGKQNGLPITKVYGGHYYSPKQAVWIDALRATLPKDNIIRTVALAALIQASSKCAAAPGHTAQPFQPTRTSKPYLTDAWGKDIVLRTKESLITLSNRFAKKKGFARVDDANIVADQLKNGDLVFIDPPYSGVHYSRFYHVLETIAHGSCGEVTGVGRYPDSKLRPRSNYSMRSESFNALDELLSKIANRGAKVILTFPDHDCSNGLSGNIVREMANKYFQTEEHTVESKFSSLGGKSNGENKQAGRSARKNTNELILLLKLK